MDVLLDKSAERIFCWLNSVNQMEGVYEDKVKYGIKIILYNLLSTMFVLIVGSLFSNIRSALIAYLAFGIFRIIAGGMHFDRSIQCLTVTSLIVAGSANVAETCNIPMFLILIMYILMFIAVYKYAPSETLTHPIKENDKGKRKKQSIILLFVYMIISLLNKDVTGKLIFIAVCCEVMTILPFANVKYHLNS